MPPRKYAIETSSLRSEKPPAPPPAATDESPPEKAASLIEDESADAVVATLLAGEVLLEEAKPPSEVAGELIVRKKVAVRNTSPDEIPSEEKVDGQAAVEEVGEEAAAEFVDGGEAASMKVNDSVVFPHEWEEDTEDPGDCAEVRENDEVDDAIHVDLGKKQEIVMETEDGDKNDGDGIVEVEELNDGDTNKSDDNADNGDNDEDDASLYIQTQMAVRNKHKRFGIFVGGLDKAAVEEDLTEVFGVFGEIQSVRVVKNPVTQKSKGYAFIHYANIDDAKKALMELKDGTEVRGKRVGISASQDNDTLYLGNICKTWTKEQVIETLKVYGVDQLEDIILPADSKIEGKTKGFAFLEFKSHSDAMEAFQRLRKPDAVFGRDRTAKVGFAETAMQASEEVMLQVKTVYVERFPVSWDENKIKEICQEYGEVEKVQLFRKSTTKRKDFAFVEFSSRESAVACVEGVNRAQLGEGDVKVKTNLARPPSKGRLAKRAACGGFRINKDGDDSKQVGQSKKKKKSKSKVVLVQSNVESKLKNDESSNKFQNRASNHKRHHESTKHDKAKKCGGGDRGVVMSERPSKKARKNYHYGYPHGRSSTIFDPHMDAYSKTPTESYLARTASHYPTYAPPATTYQGYTYPGASGSKPHYSDLTPHAGYLPASHRRQYQYGYEQRFAAYDIQPSRGSEFTGVSATQTSFPGYSNSTGYQAGYNYPSSGAYLGRNTYAPPHNYY